MKRIVVGAVLAGLSMVSTSVLADTLQCERENGTTHRIYSNSSQVQIGTEVFTFAKTGTLESGAEVYMFRSKNKMLAMAQSSEGIVYQVRNQNNQISDSGICR